MSTELPSVLLPFVRRMVAAKLFLNEDDLVAEGIRLLQAREFLKKSLSAFWQKDGVNAAGAMR